MKLLTIFLLSIAFPALADAEKIKAGADDYYACYMIAFNLNVDRLESKSSSPLNKATIYKVAGRAVETCNDVFIEHGHSNFEPAESGMRRFFEAVSSGAARSPAEAAAAPSR